MRPQLEPQIRIEVQAQDDRIQGEKCKKGGMSTLSFLCPPLSHYKRIHLKAFNFPGKQTTAEGQKHNLVITIPFVFFLRPLRNQFDTFCLKFRTLRKFLQNKAFNALMHQKKTIRTDPECLFSFIVLK
ncbi:hypothetical protein GWI33_004966 [Rhynchophorus ferrugineus]|uniref:Uncharacterized protein n=1 Tax=Rhynchophorus ferrugineus TaxID=354439 RepID=A0A834IWM8_RHYFE|nr:hypothetical protein GWI33_004966 [Rhynchophorus ferrugineus]